MIQNSHFVPWFDWCPIEVMLTLHFKWTSIGSLGWIALPSHSSLMKCKASYLRRGWVKRNSFPSLPELRIIPMAHRVTHPLSLWGYEHSWVDLPRDKASLSMSMKFHHKDHAHPWHLHSLLCQVAVSLTIISGLTPFTMVVFGFAYHNIFMQGSLLYLCTNLAVWTTINP